MRKIKLLGLSLILGLTLSGSSVLAQNGIGIIGPMIGRITNASGRGISGAVITVIPIGSCFEWAGNSAGTSSFGYYSLDVHYDCTIIVTPSKKNTVFTPSSMIISIDGGYENVNFIAN